MKARHKKVAEKNNMLIEMDPEMEKIFRQSTAVSSKFYIFKYILIKLKIYSVKGNISQLAPNREQKKKNKIIDWRRETNQFFKRADNCRKTRQLWNSSKKSLDDGGRSRSRKGCSQPNGLVYPCWTYPLDWWRGVYSPWRRRRLIVQAFLWLMI